MLHIRDTFRIELQKRAIFHAFVCKFSHRIEPGTCTANNHPPKGPHYTCLKVLQFTCGESHSHSTSRHQQRGREREREIWIIRVALFDWPVTRASKVLQMMDSLLWWTLTLEPHFSQWVLPQWVPSQWVLAPRASNGTRKLDLPLTGFWSNCVQICARKRSLLAHLKVSEKNGHLTLASPFEFEFELE